MRFSTHIDNLLAFASLVPGFLAAPSNPYLTRQLEYTVNTVTEFPNPTWLENIAVRSNGQIIVNELTSNPSTPFVWLFDPTQTWEPILVAEIPDAAGLLGIAELEEDVFYIVAGGSTLLEVNPGTNAVWRIDVRTLVISDNGTVTQPAEVTRIQTFPDGILLNGVTRLAQDDNSTLLISDSGVGSVLRLDVTDGSFETVIQDEAMFSSTGVGINGLHTFGTDLFFMNMGLSTFSRVPISLSTGRATGNITTIVENTLGDDFALSQDGTRAWIAQATDNTVTEVDITTGTGSVIAGSLNDTALATGTAVAFGRTDSDKNSIYVTTAGGFIVPVNGTTTTGGRIVKIDIPN